MLRHFAVLFFPAGVVFAQGARSADTLQPPPLHYEALAFDTHRGRLVLFGGGAFEGARPAVASTYRGQTWEWDGRRWRITSDSASGPGHRGMHAMAYDADRRRIMLVGGEPPANQPSGLCDTWSYDGQRWTRLADGPCVTERSLLPSLVYDTRQRVMLLVEGLPVSKSADRAPRSLRMWRWMSDRWDLVDSTGPRAFPMTRAVYDAHRSMLVVPVFGGPDEGVWEWDGRSWRRVAAAGPESRMGHAAIYDSRRQRVVIAGGRKAGASSDFRDVWSWDGAEWHLLSDSMATGPSARTLATFVDDPRGKRLLYFGGTTTVAPVRDLWSFDRRGWRELRVP